MNDVMGQATQIRPVDVAVAVSARVFGRAASATRRAGSALDPVAGMVLRPRWLPEQLHPGTWMEAMTQEGEARRAALLHRLSRGLDVVVPVVLTEVLRRADLTDLVLRHVDLDRVVSAVDLDAAAARLDVAAVLDRVDVDEVAQRLDVAAVADRVDVDAIVERVDLDAAARRFDLGAVLDRLDLTAVVLERVDLDALVQAVLDRVDLVRLAAEVIEGVDLPEIIRESTGSMASDTVQGVRMQGIAADEAVGRAVDRLLLRRGRRATKVPTAPGQLPSGQASIPPQKTALTAQQGERAGRGEG